MNKCEKNFISWWLDYRETSDISKKEAWDIWETAYKTGGLQPWYMITAGQWKILNANFKEDKK